MLTIARIWMLNSALIQPRTSLSDCGNGSTIFFSIHSLGPPDPYAQSYGVPAAPAYGGPGGDLVQHIKDGQRQDPAFREMWWKSRRAAGFDRPSGAAS